MKDSTSQNKPVGARTIRKILLGILLFVSIFSSGFYFGTKYELKRDGENVIISRVLPNDKQNVDFSLFWNVWDMLESKYYAPENIDERELVYGAIQGMVSAIGDPYTVFLKPEQNRLVREDLNGSFEGVGIQIGFRGSQLAVIAPLPNSPAEQAGIRAGDFIIGITDKSKGVDRGTSGISLSEAVQLIRGESGSVVTLTVLRENEEEPIAIDVRRQSIDVPTLSLEYVDDDETIAHVDLTRFGGETVSEWEKIVAELLKNPNLKGLILDVRNNPGGYLQAANDIASDFLEIGDVVVVEEDGGDQRIEYTVERLGRLRDLETVILVNEGSASASEILAGALRDNKGSILIGKTTFGKGTIQEPQELDGYVGLHITIARWLTPKGTWVNEGGLKPDIEVEDISDTIEDEQLLRAIEVLSDNLKSQ